MRVRAGASAAVTPPRCAPPCLHLTVSVTAAGNLGGLVGPALIGRVVQATGNAGAALQLLGLALAAAGALAWWMRRWQPAAPGGAAAA